jgi:hypothetical protein
MTNLFDKETTMYLVDFETSTIINYGTADEMVLQMDQSHGNLFVVSFENLNAQMKLQLQGENK